MAGKVEKQVRAILAADPDNAFTVEDLCERVYGDSPEKKHRVSMLRVIKRISDAEPCYALLAWDKPGHPLAIYDCANPHAYCMARQKTESDHGYQAKNGFYAGRERTEADLRAMLRPGGEHHYLIEEGGAWWEQSQEIYAERTGDLAEAERLRQKAAARMADFVSMMSARGSHGNNCTECGEG